MAPVNRIELLPTESESVVLPLYKTGIKRKNLNTASGPYTLAFALITGLRVSGLFFGLLETLFRLAGDRRLELLTTASKATVLPLHQSPIFTRHIIFLLNYQLFDTPKGEIVGLEPTTHRLCNLLYMSLFYNKSFKEPFKISNDL